MCTVLLPPGGNPIAVNKYININKLNVIQVPQMTPDFFRTTLLLRHYTQYFVQPSIPVSTAAYRRSYEFV